MASSDTPCNPGGYTVITIAGTRIDRTRYLRFFSSPARDFTCGPQAEYPEAPKLFEQLEKIDPVVREALKHSGDSYREPRVRAVLPWLPCLAAALPPTTSRISMFQSRL